ncbi:MAG: precorrin-2 C(20)-methyltransferase, partial [Desulfotomaculales bacterium]
LAQGKKVAFITLGDPTLYSTYTYVLKKIREAGPWETETVPGVPSFCACAAMAGVPLAEGEEKLAVVPLLKDPEALPPLLQNFENVVVMKVGGRYGDVLAALKSSGLAESSFLASRCGFPEGFVRRLAEEPPANAEGEKEGSGAEAGGGRKERPDYLSLLIVKRAKAGPAKGEGEIGEGLFHRGGSGGPGAAHA